MCLLTFHHCLQIHFVFHISNYFFYNHSILMKPLSLAFLSYFEIFQCTHYQHNDSMQPSQVVSWHSVKKKVSGFLEVTSRRGAQAQWGFSVPSVSKVFRASIALLTDYRRSRFSLSILRKVVSYTCSMRNNINLTASPGAGHPDKASARPSARF